MLAFACFIQGQSRQALRPESSDAKHQGGSELLRPEAGIVDGGDVSVPGREVQDSSPPSFAQASAPVVARPQRHAAPPPTRTQRMPDLVWRFIVRHWRTLMVVYGFCSFFLRFCEECGGSGALSPQPSQQELASGSFMYLDIQAELPEEPLTWASAARMAYVDVPGKAAPQKIQEEQVPVGKNTRSMKRFEKTAPREGVQSKSRSHQALVYIAVVFAPVALALSFALVFASPAASTRDAHVTGSFVL